MRSRLPAALAALAIASVASAVGPASAPAPVLRVEAPTALARQAAAVRALAGEDWRTVLDLVGLSETGPSIRVVLAAESSPLASHVASWVSGYAIPELGTIVLFPGRVPSYPDGNLATLLRHEVAHVLLAQAAGGATVPRWFGEGAATVAAREWGIGDGARVALATIGRGPRSLADVDAGFSGDAAEATRSYAVSAALVRYLLRGNGEDAVARVLAGMRRGAAFEGAFAAATGQTVAAFARGYFGRETFWTTWVPFVTSSTVLWMAITALALLAIKRRRDRDAALREEWAAEDRARVAGPVPPRPEDDPAKWN
jgi:hypothetical protein